MLVCQYVTVFNCVRNMPKELTCMNIYMYDPTRTNERPTATSDSINVYYLWIKLSMNLKKKLLKEMTD